MGVGLDLGLGLGLDRGRDLDLGLSLRSEGGGIRGGREICGWFVMVSSFVFAEEGGVVLMEVGWWEQMGLSGG